MPKSPEERRAYNREYYRNMTPEQKARKRERQHRNAKCYYQKNAEKRRKQEREYRATMSPEQREHLREYNRQYRLDHIEYAREYARQWKAKKRGRPLNVPPRPLGKAWTQPEIDILLARYGDMKLKDLALLLPSRTIPAILDRAEKLGIRRAAKVNSFNEHFFDFPNLLNSYWAGFIAADGNVLESPHNKLSIILKYDDRHHIERFARDIGYDGGFIDRVRQFTRPGSRPSRQFGIQVNHASTLIAALRKNFNIVPRKSLTLTPPDLTDTDLCRAYIIGFIDGDGTVCVTNRDKRLCLTSIGTMSVLLWVQKTLSEIVDISDIRIIPKGKLFSISTTGKRAELIARELSRMDVPKLDRKWAAAQAKMVSRLPGEPSTISCTSPTLENPDPEIALG